MRNFTQDEIKVNREKIIELLNKINRPNANIEGLINKMDESDFFYAPASTRFHNCIYGGLADHCLNVYDNLWRLVSMKGLMDTISNDSIIICSILHDLSKMNFYEPSIRNKKVYSDNGSKSDNLGYFDWVSEQIWAVKDVSQRLVYGTHEENSEFMIRCYIPLTLEESVAILNHHAGLGDGNVKNVGDAYYRYPLANLLHVADMLATYTDETK